MKRQIARQPCSLTSHTTATEQTTTQAITQCESRRSDGSPSCLGGSAHGWVVVNTRITPVLTTVRRLWVAHTPQPRALHRYVVSPRQNCLKHGSGASVGRSRVSAFSQHVKQCRACDAGHATSENKTTLETHCEATEYFPPVHQCRSVDDYRMHTCGPRGTCVDAVNSYSCDCDPGCQEKDIDGDTACENIDDRGDCSVFRAEPRCV